MFCDAHPKPSQNSPTPCSVHWVGCLSWEWVGIEHVHPTHWPYHMLHRNVLHVCLVRVGIG